MKNSVAVFLSAIPVIDDDMYSKYVNLGLLSSNMVGIIHIKWWWW